MLRRLQRSLVFPTRGRSMSSANNTMRTRRVLCVFDFDWSFINENSDTFVFDALAPHLVPYLRAKRRELEWTPLMHHMQQKLVEELNLKAADVLQAMERIPVHPEMHDVRRRAACSPCGTACPLTARRLQLMACLADERFESIIISDANEHYIDHILRHHRLHDRFSAIYTNKSALGEDGVLSIAPFHTGDPHACPHCPPNLCKGAQRAQCAAHTRSRAPSCPLPLTGKVMDDVLRGREIDRIVYVGDGAGDYCPATRLRRYAELR